MTGNDVINEKDLGGKIPSFSSSSTSTSSTESSSRDGTTSSSSSSSSGTSSTSASSGSTRRSSRSISRASSEAAALNHQLVIVPSAPPRSPSVASSPLLGGLSVKETLRFVLAEIESLRKSVQEIETVKSKLAAIDTLQLEIEHLSSKFQDMAQDYVGMTQQVEELTKGSSSTKQVKSGWGSGWKKVTKTFQSKDQELHKNNETPPLPPLKLPSESDHVPVLRTSKSDTLHPKTPRADVTKAAARADSMPITKRTPTKSTESVTLQHPNTPRAEASPVATTKAVKVPESLPPTAGNSVSSTPRGPKKETIESRDSSFGTTTEQEIIPRSGDLGVKGKEGYAITAHRSHHVEDLHRRSVRSRSASPEQLQQRGSHRSERQKGSQGHRSESVTSTSSYSSTSGSARSGHGHRSAHRQRQRGHSGSLNKERYHDRKPRSHSGHHSHKEHSVDSRGHRHSSAAQGGQSGHHRGYHEGSVASTHHTKEGSEHHSGSHRSAHRHSGSHHRRHQSFSDDSDHASGDFVARSRRSQH